MISEKDVECYFCTQIKKLKWLPFKFVSPGNAGVPDRLVVTPVRIVFVELKAPGKKTRPLQNVQIAKIGRLGHKVEILDSRESVDNFIKWLKEINYAVCTT